MAKRNKKTVGIIGAGRFGRTLAETLIAQNIDVIVIDTDENAIKTLAQYNIHAVQGDGTNHEALKEAGFESCDIAVVSISESLENSILATLNCKQLGIYKVISKAETELQETVLYRIGADEVVFPDKERAYRLGRDLSGIRGAIESLRIAKDYSVNEIKVPHKLIGKTIIEANIRQTYNVNVIAIKRMLNNTNYDTELIIATGAEVLREDDSLIVFGSDKLIAEMSDDA
ncbi:MAG: TrkA family potassium uptake protein [Kiritimatiellae bacterium]|jgi:trk system potassium uptake protein TrkA|nr:TrkA family potassium uptake protein [Kiritimatiellia bacterium]